MATLAFALQSPRPYFRQPKEAEMNVVNTSTVLLSAAVLLLTAACSKQAEQVSSATEQASDALNKESWIDDVRLSSTTAAPSQAGYAAGDTLQLSMSVEDAPRGTMVTTYWYGPENRQLSYESQTVDPNERQLNFDQENTHAWEPGSYRAEVWVGQDKVEEEKFDIVAG
jgi:hypothetical protein